MSEQAPRVSVMEETVPAVTILATTVTTIGEVEEDGVVNSVTYTPNANITGAASPASRTCTLVNKGQDGNGSTVIATLAFIGGVNGLDFDELAATLSVVAGARNVVEGDVLAWNSAPVGGTGLVDPGGRVKIEIGRS